MHSVLRLIVRHLIVFVALLVLVTAIVFGMSLFVEMHPDAYRDGLLSIVYVYPFVLVAGGIYVLVRRVSRKDRPGAAESVMRCYRECGLFTGIAVVFTLITVMNSIMMLTGVDAPKQGLFTYQHMLIRMVIVTGAIMVAMGRETLKAVRKLFTFFGSDALTRQSMLSEFVARITEAATQRPFQASANSFTALTFLICVAAIVVSFWSEVAGGSAFYTALLILYGALLVVFTAIMIAMATSACEASRSIPWRARRDTPNHRDLATSGKRSEC